MRIMSYNTLFGGHDGSDNRRYEAQIKLVNEVKPDVLLVQEAKDFQQAGMKLLLAMEDACGMRGFLAHAPHTGQNTGIFIRTPIKPLSFEADAVHFHHAAAIVTLALPDVSKPVTVISVHLCPFGPHVRMREANYLTNYADDAAFTLLAGDFNSVSPHDPEPLGLEDLPARFRARYTTPGAGQADRNVMQAFYHAGFVDIGHRLGKHTNPTVPTVGYVGTEFVPFRSDYLLATKSLASHATDYDVIVNALSNKASDHYPIVADFNI